MNLSKLRMISMVITVKRTSTGRHQDSQTSHFSSWTLSDLSCSLSTYYASVLQLPLVTYTGNSITSHIGHSMLVYWLSLQSVKQPSMSIQNIPNQRTTHGRRDQHCCSNFPVEWMPLQFFFSGLFSLHISSQQSIGLTSFLHGWDSEWSRCILFQPFQLSLTYT